MRTEIPYVWERDGVWQYERRVPVAVRRRPDRFAAIFGSRPLFRRSLRTKSQNAMLGMAGFVDREFERLVAKALADEPPAHQPIALVPPATRKLLETDLSNIADRYRHLTAEPFERLHRLADADPQAAAELGRMEYELEQRGEAIRSALKPGVHAQEAPIMLPLEEARYVADEHGLDAPAGSEALGLIARAIRVGMDQGYARIVSLSDGAVIPTLPSKAKITSKSISIRDAVGSYVEQKDLPTKTISEVNLSLRTFESVVGNKAIDAISRGDINDYVEHIASQKIGGKSAGSIARFPQEDTIKKRLGFINAAINHVIDRGLFDGRNPASNIKVSAYVKRVDRSIMPVKRRFKVTELNKLFQHPWFTGCRSATETHQPGSYRLDGVEYWGPIVALLTGCRAAELAGLRIADVRLDDRHPHLLIRPNQYRGIKNGEAREVPIIDMLMDHGFADHFERIARTGADRFFPDWKGKASPAGGQPAWSNGPMMRAFNRTVVPAALGEELVTGARLEVTFHGLRGAFKTMLSTHEPAVNINIINEVVGHAKSELDSRYLGKLPIESTYRAIRGCRYEGLNLPPIPR